MPRNESRRRTFRSPAFLCDCACVVRLQLFGWLTFLGTVYGCSYTPGGPVTMETPPAEPLVEGRQLYREACAACHGLTGQGDGPVAPALKAAPTDLTRLSERHGGIFPRDLVIETIEGENAIVSHGKREMPVWSTRFTPTQYGATAVASVYARRQVELLTAYIEALQRR